MGVEGSQGSDKNWPGAILIKSVELIFKAV